jgi:hypothetical protein
MKVKNRFKLEAILMLVFFLAWPLVGLCLTFIFKPHQIGHLVHSAPAAASQGK